MKASKYMRTPFFAAGVQVTLENIEAVARWCHGEIINRDTPRPFIRIEWTGKPTKNRNRFEAKLGYYILQIGDSFKVYTQDWLDKSFLLVEDDVDLEIPDVVPTTEQVVHVHSCCTHEHKEVTSRRGPGGSPRVVVPIQSPKFQSHAAG